MPPQIPPNFMTTLADLGVRAPGLQRRALQYLLGFLKRVEAGEMPAYHGTSNLAAQRIMKEGFQVNRGPQIVDEALTKYGLTRPEVPKRLLEWISREAEQRTHTNELGKAYFTPSRSVAEHFARAGGETPEILDLSVRQYLAARRAKPNLKTPGEIYDLMDQKKLPNFWSNEQIAAMQGGTVPKPPAGSIIKADIPLTPDEQEWWSAWLSSMTNADPRSTLRWLGLEPEIPSEVRPMLLPLGRYKALRGGKGHYDYSEVKVPPELLGKIKIRKLIRLSGLLAPLLAAWKLQAEPSS